MSGFPWNFIWSPFFKFRFELSKMINSVSWPSNCIVVLNFESWIDSIIPVCVGFDPARKVRVKIPMRVRISVSSVSFIDFFFLESRAIRVPFGQNFSSAHLVHLC